MDICYVPYGLANLGNIKSLSLNASKIFDSHIWSDHVIFEIWYHSQRVSSKAQIVNFGADSELQRPLQPRESVFVI